MLESTSAGSPLVESVRDSVRDTGAMPVAIDDRALLLRLNDVVGPLFGTEDFSLFLYSLVRMQAPRVIVELGTGFGVSAFWMALAAKRNRFGHVWTIDDWTLFERRDLIEPIVAKLREANFISLESPTAEHYYAAISQALQLDAHLTLIKAGIDLARKEDFDCLPFGDKPIDLLFSDFKHGPMDVLTLLGQFLPRMAPASSIFIDSASTSWPSYLLLEQLAGQLNAGQVPKALQDLCHADLGEVVRNRRFALVHLTERKNRSQNSTAWLKLEPVDLFPHPQTKMRAVFRDPPVGPKSTL